ncbi:MAG TPA: hypothetical protein VH475_16300 [Tepidisphaeraceae bacterium]|jgi:hypothetical protein
MEEILPPQTEFGAGFEPTRIRQFTIFLENKVGRLQQLVRIFEEQAAKIVALSIEESGDAALVRLICADPDLGKEVLLHNGFPFGETDLLAVELPKKTKQPLIAICSALLSAEINIHYAYPLLLRPHGPTLALYVDEPTLAAQIMIRKGFSLIGESDLKG